MSSQILNIALCLIVRENKILLLRRAKPPYQGWLGLPGGKMQFGEAPETAGLREAMEETGLAFRDCRVAGCATEIIRSITGQTLAQFTMFPVILDDAEGEPQSGCEGELEWHALAALHTQTRIIPTDADLIARFWPDGGGNPCPHYEIEENAGSYRILSIRN